MQVTLTQIKIISTDKSGNQLMSKTGKPYSFLKIQTKENGEKWLSGFKGKQNEHWKVGDTVEIEVKKNGDYLNYEIPKKETSPDSKILQNIHMELSGIKLGIRIIAEHVGVDVEPAFKYPTEKINADEITFDQPF